MKEYLRDNFTTNAQTTSDAAKFLVPSVFPVMVTEKDLYIASVLRECPGERVVAVVGRGHVAGITQHLCDKDDPYLLRAELSRTSRISQSPLARQAALATGALTAVTAAVAVFMARRLNQAHVRTSTSATSATSASTTSTTSTPTLTAVRRTSLYRGTLPITLLLLTLEVGIGWMWLTNEWLKFHTAVTQAVLTYRDEEETRRTIETDNKKRK